jgi:hypothetical protein
MNLKSRDSISKTFIWFLIALGALNLLQAFLTPINPDEAYYWMYSKYLAWGYFDHPPMIAIMIRIGDMIFHNEMGVRFLVVVSQIGTLWIIWDLINEDQSLNKGTLYIFMMLVAILPVFNIYGFIATPDAPLLFFTAVFLLVYKRFLQEDSWKNTLLLGVSMACLVYSKYHGALLIIFVILSNLKLLKSPKFYIASTLAVLLFIPHLLWQYSNDFPSIKYHLVDRVSGFVIGNVPQYLLNLLLIHNPFILPVCIWLIVKGKPKNQFEKTLSYIIYGFIIFFFISSFRYRVEPQWTALISVPMVILLFRNPGFNTRFGGYIKWVTIFFLPVLLFVRLAFMVDFLPVSYLKKGYHNTRKRAIEISKIAGDRPVVFTNSYQDASKYTFYTGKFAHTLNNLNYRKNQYDLWDFEEKIHGKEVLYVPHFMTDNIRNTFTKHVFSTGDSAYVKVYKDFQSLQRECVILSDKGYNYSISKTNSINLKIFNPYPFQINLNNKDFPVVFQIGFFKNGRLEFTKRLILPESIVVLKVGEAISTDCSFTLESLAPGKYKIAICSESGIQYITTNSAFREAMVTE